MSRQYGKLNDRRMAIFSLQVRKVMTATLPCNEWSYKEYTQYKNNILQFIEDLFLLGLY